MTPYTQPNSWQAPRELPKPSTRSFSILRPLQRWCSQASGREQSHKRPGSLLESFLAFTKSRDLQRTEMDKRAGGDLQRGRCRGANGKERSESYRLGSREGSDFLLFSHLLAWVRNTGRSQNCHQGWDLRLCWRGSPNLTLKTYESSRDMTNSSYDKAQAQLSYRSDWLSLWSKEGLALSGGKYLLCVLLCFPTKYEACNKKI